MVNNLPDGRSPIAVAIHWASQVTTISVEMVLPALLGVWADQKLGTKAVFTILGGILGLWLGVWNLMRIAKELDKSDKKQTSDRQKPRSEKKNSL